MTRDAFVIGPSRSSISVLAQANGAHPQDIATGELHFYNLLAPANTCADWREYHTALLAQLKIVQHNARLLEVKNSTAPDLPNVTPDKMPEADAPLFQAFFDALARAARATAVVEQTPMNFYYRDRIRADFPGVVFFLMRRDPRTILASQKMFTAYGHPCRAPNPYPCHCPCAPRGPSGAATDLASQDRPYRGMGRRGTRCSLSGLRGFRP